MISIVVISPDDSEGVVLAKVMKVAKEIRSGDKNAGPLRLGAGRLCGLLAAACLSGCRRCKEGGTPPVVAFWVACLAAAGGLPGMAGAGNGPAAICGGNSAVFNQPLTIFLVVAMVWWLSVFFLCSYQQFRRCWRLFRSPGAGRWWSVSVGGLGLLAVGSGNGRGSGKRDGASQDWGRVLPHILPTPPRTLGWRKTGRGPFCNPGLK